MVNHTVAWCVPGSSWTERLSVLIEPVGQTSMKSTIRDPFGVGGLGVMAGVNCAWKALVLL